MTLKTLAAFALFFLLFPFICSGAEQDALRHSLQVKVDIQGRSITGTDTIALEKGTSELSLILRSGSEVTRVEGGSADLPFETREGRGVKEITVKVPPGDMLREITVHFRGTFQSPKEAESQIKRGVAYIEDGIIGEEGVFLPSSSFWYPQNRDFTVFEAVVTLPAGYSSVMEGELTDRRIDASTVVERWIEWKPVDGIDLIAGRYKIEKDTHKGVDIYTYFFKEDASLSRTYIDKTKEYLDTYSELFGPYPFGKFAVVENFLPTGYGMPSFTLLGSSVIRLPFIPDTSLGHEIAHNWWGNSVFIDSSLGNWSEALTTYTADYLFEKRKGGDKAREFRAAKLRSYKNFAEESPISLKDFRDSTSTESRAVGYNKGVMVFNMLEAHIGEAAFRDGLKRFYAANAFKRASWADIQAAFEAASGSSLDWFFDQWLKNTGGPALTLADAQTIEADGKHIVSFRVEQAGTAYILDLPVRIETASGPVWRTFSIKSASDELTAELDSKPLSIELDPDYQNFRILSDAEAPPTFAGFFGDKEAVIILPNRNDIHDKYMPAADMLAKDYGLNLTTDADIGKKDYLKDHSIFIFGGPKENRLYWLSGRYFSKSAAIGEDAFEVAGRSFPRKGSVLVLAAKNPHAPSKTLCLFITDLGKDAVLDAARRIRYFTDSSWLVITPDGKAERGTFEGDKTLKRSFK